MFVPIGDAFKVLNEIGDIIEISFVAFFTVMGIIFLIWLHANRGLGCKQPPKTSRLDAGTNGSRILRHRRLRGLHCHFPIVDLLQHRVQHVLSLSGMGTCC